MDKEDKKYLKKIGKNIAIVRRQKGMTQEEVCTELDMDKPYLSSIENGRQNPTLLTLLKLAEAMNVEVKEFLNI